MGTKYTKQVKIISLLEERGISHRSFAERIGMKEDTLSRKLNGTRRLYLEEIRAISEEMRVPTEKLFITEGEQK